MCFRDAAWETEPNAFAELLEVPDTCEAAECVCPQGRDYENTQYTLVRCDTCGSHCVHNKCLLTKEPFTCAACILPSAQPEEPTEEMQVEPTTANPEEPAKSNEIEKNTQIDVEEDSSDTSEDEIMYPSQWRTNSSVKWSSIISKITKHKDASNADKDDKDHEPVLGQAVAEVKNLSNLSDVEIVETKEEVLCISDDDTENPPPNLSSSVVKEGNKKRTNAESPPVPQPNKKVRRALETMRNQSKITSFFSVLGGNRKSNETTSAGSE